MSNEKAYAELVERLRALRATGVKEISFCDGEVVNVEFFGPDPEGDDGDIYADDFCDGYDCEGGDDD